MPLDRTQLLVLGGGSLGMALIWLGAKLGATRQRLRQRRAGRVYNERGQAGERRAEHLLRAAGYRICGRHVSASYGLEVDGGGQEIQLIADLVVERQGERWVAEVKTGRNAPRLGHAETRRQMLEYQVAFGVPGVLLVDPEADRIRQVRFPVDARPASKGPASAVMLAVLATISLALVAWYWVHRQ